MVPDQDPLLRPNLVVSRLFASGGSILTKMKGKIRQSHFILVKILRGSEAGAAPPFCAAGFTALGSEAIWGAEFRDIDDATVS